MSAAQAGPPSSGENAKAHVRSMRSKSVPAASQCRRRTSSLWGISGAGRRLQASAQRATRASVRRSPPPATRTPGRGRRSVEAAVVAVRADPHPGAELQGVLKQLVAGGRPREGDAETLTLLPVVTGADAQPGAATGEDVQGGHRLRQHGRVPEVDPRGQGHQPDRARVGGEEAEGRVRLQARAFGAAHDRVLPQVVADRDAVEASLVGQRRDFGEQAG